MWFRRHRLVVESIKWRDDPSSARSWAYWTAEEKNQLFELLDRLEQGESVPLVDPPPNQRALADDEYPSTVLADEHAWPLFLAHVAQSIHADLNHLVPWSLRNYSATERAILFDSDAFFDWRPDYGRLAGSGGAAIPAPPDAVYGFLVAENLIGPDRPDTIARLLEWVRQNLAHFRGGLTASNFERQWQYRGLPPLSRILGGTPFTGDPADGIRHRTAGCGGTVGFLRNVLRVVNVPVECVFFEIPNFAHAAPWFVSHDLFLTHGDDPYNQFAQGNPPPYPVTDLLIDGATFEAWFGEGVSPDQRAANMGRRVLELALVYLPNGLLRTHCRDLAAGRPPAASEVAAAYARLYSVAELEALNLWSRMDEKIASLGGCEAIP